MIGPAVVCRDDGRRLDVRRAGLNGIDYLDVADDQLSLCVHLFGPVPDGLTPANFVIEGGRRIRGIKVVDVGVDDSADVDGDACLRVVVDRPGDGSRYRLCVVALDSKGHPAGVYPGFDAVYACIEFTFTASCPSDFDCALPATCPPVERPEPSISYLAKDYGSFRNLILDRLARLVPDWTERHVPDLGVTLVDLLAYVGDQLSYYQDAVATEAFLGTARHRISVRRHARLVDYHVDEGTAARAWVHIEVPAGDVVLPAGASLVTAIPGVQGRGTIAIAELPGDGGARYESFEPLFAGLAPVLRQGHNRIELHTWGDELCCLPKGAMAATLRDGPPRPEPTATESTSSADDEDVGRVLHLEPGDLLLFEEVVGPSTANPADADPSHRHVVRIVRVTKGVDELYDQPVVEVEWREEDALPFPLCVSTLGPAPACAVVEPVSVARGNIMLVEHGRRGSETIGPVPELLVADACEAPCRPAQTDPMAAPFRPDPLQSSPLAFSEPITWSRHGVPTAAAELLGQDGHAAVPLLELRDDGHHAPPGTSPRWEACFDLLGSGPDDQHVAVEIDDDRQAHLRFGDDELGQRPAPGMLFTASYRIGGGRTGNVGADTIVHLVVEHLDDARGLQPRNPLAAMGGKDPERLQDVRLVAPYAFRGVIERAITADDYATLATRIGGARLQRAAASLRWTGSWFRADVVLDVRASVPGADDVLAVVAQDLPAYRRIGHDLTVMMGRTVPILVGLEVCVQPHALLAHVRAGLVDVLGRGRTSSGRLGFFDPDRFTFGQSVEMSQLVAAAMSVNGVESVTVSRLERVGQGPSGEIDAAYLLIGPLEIARLDNDPSFPEEGQLELTLRGGR